MYRTLLFLAILCSTAQAQTAPKTDIAKPTECIVATAFDQTTAPVRKGPICGWQAGIGEWEVKDGVLCGKELEEDKHPSSCTYRFEAKNMVITAQFRLGGASQIAFGCRDTVPPNLHLARTVITPTGIWIQRMSGISKTTKSVKLQEIKEPIDHEAWHTLTIEIVGDRYLAKVDNHKLEAKHERFADAKGIVALINKGEGAQFKNVALWKAE